MVKQQSGGEWRDWFRALAQSAIGFFLKKIVAGVADAILRSFFDG